MVSGDANRERKSSDRRALLRLSLLLLLLRSEASVKKTNAVDNIINKHAATVLKLKPFAIVPDEWVCGFDGGFLLYLQKKKCTGRVTNNPQEEKKEYEQVLERKFRPLIEKHDDPANLTSKNARTPCEISDTSDDDGRTCIMSEFYKKKKKLANTCVRMCVLKLVS